MIDSLKESIRVSPIRETVGALSVSPKLKRSEKWYSKVPAAVSLDLSISSDAFRVYAVMSLWTFQKSSAYIGMRQLSKLTGLSPATVMRRLRELIKAGHLTVAKDSAGKRSRYDFTSPVFAAAPIKPQKPTASPGPKADDNPMVRCPKCRKYCRRLLKVGYCRSCNWDIKIDRKIRGVVREEIDKGDAA